MKLLFCLILTLKYKQLFAFNCWNVAYSNDECDEHSKNCDIVTLSPGKIYTLLGVFNHIRNKYASGKNTSQYHILEWNKEFVMPKLRECESQNKQKINYNASYVESGVFDDVDAETIRMISGFREKARYSPINEVGCGILTIKRRFRSDLARFSCTSSENVKHCTADELNSLGYPYLCGKTGILGEKGDAGTIGRVPKQSAKGDSGYNGQKGIRGDFGSKGNIGPKGDTGSDGFNQKKGVRGMKGKAGQTGIMGAKGIKGETGETGKHGAAGEQGDLGNIECETTMIFYEDKRYWITYGVAILGLAANVIYVIVKSFKTTVKPEQNLADPFFIVDRKPSAYEYTNTTFDAGIETTEHM